MIKSTKFFSDSKCLPPRLISYFVKETSFDFSFKEKMKIKCFQRDGTVQLFGTKGQRFLPCPRTKGQWDKLKILPRDEPGRDSQNSGQDGTGQPKSRDKGFCPGTFAPALVPEQRDTGTSRPVETLPGTSLQRISSIFFSWWNKL